MLEGLSNIGAALGLTSVSSTERDKLLGLLENGDIAGFNELRPKLGLDLSGVNLSSKDLSGVDFSNVCLVGANLSRCNLVGAKLVFADLRQSDLSRTSLNRACFHNAQLDHANLKDVRAAEQADFSHACLRAAELSGGRFNKAIFFESILTRAMLAKVTANYADFTRAKLEHSLLKDGKFRNAIMVESNLLGAVMPNAEFIGSNLVGAILFQCQAQGADFAKANLTRVNGGKSVFDQATQFSGAYIFDFKYKGATLEPEWLNECQNRIPPENEYLVSNAKVPTSSLVQNIPGTDKKVYDQAMQELNDLIGVEEIKKFIHDLVTLLITEKQRQDDGVEPIKLTLNFEIRGKTGTGKTTVADIIVKLLYSLGYLSENKLIEVTRENLVSDVVGGSEKLASEFIRRAKGGGGFVDEAYQLTEEKEGSFGHKALGVILVDLGRENNDTCYIFAGLSERMEAFWRTNNSLRPRVPYILNTPDFTIVALGQILELKLKKTGFNFAPELITKACEVFSALKQIQGEQFGNARVVKYFIEALALNQGRRLQNSAHLAVTRSERITFTLEDVPRIEDIKK